MFWTDWGIFLNYQAAIYKADMKTVSGKMKLISRNLYYPTGVAVDAKGKQTSSGRG